MNTETEIKELEAVIRQFSNNIKLTLQVAQSLPCETSERTKVICAPIKKWLDGNDIVQRVMKKNVKKNIDLELSDESIKNFAKLIQAFAKQKGEANANN